MRTYVVELLITTDEIESPADWDWNELLDMGAGEDIKVERVELVAEPDDDEG